MMKKGLILTIVILLLAASCRPFIDPSAAGSEHEGYTITVSVPDDSLLSETSGARALYISSIEITAEASGFLDETMTLYRDGDGLYTGNIHLAAGVWEITADAYYNGVLAYSGSTEFNTSTDLSIAIGLIHESGAIRVSTGTGVFTAGSMDSFQVTASRSGFDSIIKTAAIPETDTGAVIDITGLTSGNWDFTLEILNDGYVYFSNTFPAIEIVTNEMNLNQSFPIQYFQTKVLPVQFTPADGIYAVDGSVNVTMSSGTPGAQIRYTLDPNPDPSVSSGNTYLGSPINVSEPTTFKAIAYTTSGNLQPSVVTTITYMPVLPEVEFSVEEGTYEENQNVELSCETTQTGYTIYYTTDGSSLNDSGGIAYDPGSPISINQSMEIHAIARKTGFHDSPEASASYTLQMPAVTISPDGGTFDVPTDITLSCTDPGDGIYFTTDGSFPDAVNGTLYSSVFPIFGDMTLRAAAVRTGWTSVPTEAEFTIFIKPTPASPVSDVSLNDTTPTFDWNDIAGAESYHIQYIDTASAASIDSAPVYTVSGADPESEYMALAELDVNTNYSWRVKALKTGAETEWSDVGTFIIEIDAGITINPINPVIDLSLNITDGELVEIVTDSTRRIAATTNPEAATFQWYLDGELISGETSAFYEIGDGLANGESYTISCIAIDGTTMASESVEFTVAFTDPEIGMEHEGGIIFYLDGTGGGLVVSEEDQSTGVSWSNGSDVLVGTGLTIGSGQANTTAIVNTQGAGEYAASICSELVLNGFDDWYLPSRDELYEIHQALNDLGIGDFNTINEKYWSSSEYSQSGVYILDLYSGGSIETWGSKNSTYYYVRAVRAF